eukprot:CAMPEP_0203760322 /NCGR_PEP_ID=MMETSP0098-20131031/13641_1 /ASSEMBLY_ACC=CAM_ASM_000208 /TAXON_ID=96639 /ORGANISM=" , Strain NY0313808BC1" /LENGTH=917 /DNA_ID=CAMNT_0050653835 /DNA_START=81 /DNA_END=2834 /DNA_ORIENTATION=+
MSRQDAVDLAKLRSRQTRKVRSNSRRRVQSRVGERGLSRSYRSGSGNNALLQMFEKRAGQLPIVQEELRHGDKENVGLNARIVPQKSFYFQQRHGKIDLRAISRVDLEALVEQVDIETLQTHLENITFSELDDADMKTYTDDNFMKLFRLTQLTVEYLLNVQHTLYSYATTLERQAQGIQNEQVVAEQKMDMQNEQLTSLRRELKQKKRTLKTYEFLLTQKGARTGDGEGHLNNNFAHDAAQNEYLQQQAALREQQQAQLREQMDTMERVLKDEAEKMKAQLLEQMDKQRQYYEAREVELQRKQAELEAKMNDGAQKQASSESKGKVSLAGAFIEEDDLQDEVSELLGGTLHDVKAQLSLVLQENESLKSELRQVLDMRSATVPGSKHSKTVEPSLVKNSGKEGAVEQETKDAPGKEDEATLMVELSSLKVSRNLSDQRSMQLRRVLRLVRRRLQLRGFALWKTFLVEAQARAREEKLRKDMEQLLEATKDDPELDAREEFIASYKWQDLPAGFRSDPRLQMQTGKGENGSDRVRIPRVWPLEMKTSLGKSVSVPVTRTMSISQVKQTISKEMNKPITKIRLRKGGSTGETLDDDLTVQEGDFFYKAPYVQFVTGELNEAAIQKIVEEYSREKEELVEPKSSFFQPVQGMPEVKSKWYHSHEEIESMHSDIHSELSRSLGSSHGLGSTYQSKASSKGSSHGRPSPALVASPAVSAESDVKRAPNPSPKQDKQPSPIQSVPVNFGDYDSGREQSSTGAKRYDARSETSNSRTDYSTSDADDMTSTATTPRSMQSGGKPPKLKLESFKSSVTKETIAKRYLQTMSHFNKVGLVRRAQVDTLDLSDDSGSSRTETSMSVNDDSAISVSEGDELSKTGQSFFDVNDIADKYEEAGSDTNSAYKPNITINQILDDMDSDESD